MKNVFKKIVAGAVTAVSLLPAMAFAATPKGLTEANKAIEEIGAKTGSTGVPLTTLIANLINVVLSVMGIVFVVLIVYAGILYMQAGTDPKKADTAKKIIVNAVIGLVIVVAAYAISSFIIGQIIASTV